VHDAKASAAPGSVGKAVSLAACIAAHDRSTLPEGAQQAPGQADKEPKDCSKGDGTASPTPAADGTISPSSEAQKDKGQKKGHEEKGPSKPDKGKGP
jgi:hypothetical protein